MTMRNLARKADREDPPVASEPEPAVLVRDDLRDVIILKPLLVLIQVEAFAFQSFNATTGIANPHAAVGSCEQTPDGLRHTQFVRLVHKSFLAEAQQQTAGRCRP